MWNDTRRQGLLEPLLPDGDVQKAETVLLVAAHPDDEVIGAGAVLTRLGTGATIVHLTDGAPRRDPDVLARFDSPETYAHVRRKELLAALALAGVPGHQALRLDVPDQEASFHLVSLCVQLAAIIATRRPRTVVTHPYEGGHPDHDAAAFCTAAACRLLGPKAPALVEMTSYHATHGTFRSGTFLPSSRLVERTLRLSALERELKRRMLDCFVTQASVLAPFGVEVERFRSAPSYDFTRPPHSGRLHYENFDWGMTGVRWRELARDALERTFA